MAHFSSSDWIDFVRRLATPARHAEIERHLSTGCRPCRRAATLFGKVRSWARSEVAREMPTSLKDGARVLFRRRQLRPEPSASMVTWLQQGFDSLFEPAVAFARSAEPQSWQGLYEGSRWLVDLRVDRHHRRPALSLMGQLTNVLCPDQQPSGAWVEVLREGRVVATTPLLPRGEFEVEVPQGGELLLLIRCGEGATLGLSLGDLTARLEVAFPPLLVRPYCANV